ncbi:hypothetical protein Tco_0365133 [Tanacetum coccineum]
MGCLPTKRWFLGSRLLGTHHKDLSILGESYGESGIFQVWDKFPPKNVVPRSLFDCTGSTKSGEGEISDNLQTTRASIGGERCFVQHPFRQIVRQPTRIYLFPRESTGWAHKSDDPTCQRFHKLGMDSFDGISSRCEDFSLTVCSSHSS